MKLSAISYQLSAIGAFSAVPLSLPGSHLSPLTSHLPPPADSVPGSELSVTLLTYETGERIWERFGHNALWIHNSVTGADDHYDYGRFNFERPHFVLRFLQGRMWYSMGYERNVAGMVALYARQGRKIWAQELELTPEQRLALRKFLEWNIQPEHAEYFYDYYRDNCSTRIRDALDRVIGGAIRRYGEQPSSLTWRDETRRLNEHNVPLYTGMLLALGQPVDLVMTRWEQMFLPGRLREHLDSVRVQHPDGSLHPLVKSQRVLSAGGSWPVPERPSNRILGYLIVGVLTGALLLALARSVLFLPIATLWALVAGLAGALLTYLSLFSHHLAAHRNENLLLLSLVSLPLAVCLPPALRGSSWALRPARSLAMASAGLALFALLLKPLPWFAQHNLELIGLVLPIHVGVWLGLERAVRR